MRRFLLTVAAAVVVVGFPGGAAAGWAIHGSGSGAVKAKTLGTGAAPTTSVSGRKVTVTWTAITYTNGGNAAGYVIKRYDASTDALQTILSACTGTLTTLTCIENNVPKGSWKYTVTPATANWRGPESAKSATVTV